jgi:hypothetical protein
LERQKNDTPINRRPARSRRDGSCLRPKGPHARRDPEATAPEERRERRYARKHSQRHGLDLGQLQRQVARRGGSLRIVIEFPAEPRPVRRGRRPRFV